MPDPTEARTRRLWARLGADGTLRDLYAQPDPRFGLAPERLRRLLTELHDTEPVGTTLSVVVQVATAIPLLLAAGATEVADTLLSGGRQMAFAATDAAAAGSDLTDLGTSIQFGQSPTLTGGKRWIVNATTAEWALVLARHAPGRGFTSFTMALVPLDQPGVTRHPAATTAFGGSGVGDLTFSEVPVEPDAVLGGRGRGLALFARQMAGERLASGLWAATIAGRALADTRRLLGDRSVGDRPLAEHGAVRHRLAAAVVEQQSLAALGDQLCEPPKSTSDGRGDDVLARAAVLKAAGARTLERVLAVCGDLAGADGFRPGGVQDLRREAAMFGIAGGSTATMLDVIADHVDALLPGQPLPENGKEAQ